MTAHTKSSKFPDKIWIGTNLWEIAIVEDTPNNEVAGCTNPDTYTITLTKDQHKTMAATLLHEVLEIIMLENNTCEEMEKEPFEYRYTLYHCPARQMDIFSAIVTKLYETLDRNNLWEVMA
jgi:hypothetical protein